MKKRNTIKELQKEGLITTADKIPVPDSEGILAKIKTNPVRDFSESRDEFNAMFLIGMEISVYCELEGIIPQDLINLHKEVNKSKLGRKQGKEVKIQDLTKESSVGKPFRPDKSNWRNDYIKAKTGQK